MRWQQPQYTRWQPETKAQALISKITTLCNQIAKSPNVPEPNRTAIVKVLSGRIWGIELDVEQIINDQYLNIALDDQESEVDNHIRMIVNKWGELA